MTHYVSDQRASLPRLCHRHRRPRPAGSDQSSEGKLVGLACPRCTNHRRPIRKDCNGRKSRYVTTTAPVPKIASSRATLTIAPSPISAPTLPGPSGHAAFAACSDEDPEACVLGVTERVRRGTSPISVATQRSPGVAIPTISRHHRSRSSDSVHTTTSITISFTGPQLVTRLTTSENTPSTEASARCLGDLPMAIAGAAGTTMPPQRQLRGQQLTTVVVALHVQSLTAPAISCSSSENRLIVGFEELVAARSVFECYLVSFHHATTCCDAKPCRGSAFRSSPVRVRYAERVMAAHSTRAPHPLDISGKHSRFGLPSTSHQFKVLRRSDQAEGGR